MRGPQGLIAGLALLAAAAAPTVGVSAAGGPEPAGICPQPGSSPDSALAPAGNGWDYLYQGGHAGLLWRWTGSRWVRAGDTGAPGLSSPALAPEMRGLGLMLVGTGSEDARHRLHLQTWRWRGGHWTRLHPGSSPPGGYYRLQLSLALDRAHGLLLLAETVSDARYAVHNELWGWNGSTWRRLASDEPGQITGTAVPMPIATGPGGAVYGFTGAGAAAGRFVRWTGHAFVAVHAAGAPEAVAGLTTDPVHGALIALGGPRAQIPDIPFPTIATYVFAAAGWSHLGLPAPLHNRVGMLMAPDPKHGTTLLWGGERSYGFAAGPHRQPPAYPATWSRRTQWTVSQGECA